MHEAHPESLGGIVEIDKPTGKAHHQRKGEKSHSGLHKMERQSSPALSSAVESSVFKAEAAKSGTVAKYIKENIRHRVRLLSAEKASLVRGIRSAQSVPAHLDDMTFRFNNRNNPFLFRDTLLRLIEAPVLENKLTAA